MSLKNNDEKKLLKLFKLIEQLFEKLIESDHTKTRKKNNQDVKDANEGQTPNKNKGLLSAFNEDGSESMILEKSPKDPRTFGVKTDKDNIRKSSNTKREEELNVFDKVKDQVRSRFETLLDDANLKKLWLNLIEVLNYIGDHLLSSKASSSSQIQPMITEMQPLMESFFIIYKLLCDNDYLDKIKKNLLVVNRNQKKLDAPKNQISNFVKDSEIVEVEDITELEFEELRQKQLSVDDMFLIMCQKNRKLLNFTFKKNINLLNESLSVIPKKMPKIIDFENKCEYFKSQINKLTKNYRHHLCNMNIRRNEVFTDSFNQIMNRGINELRGKLRIEFKMEEGEDAGGLTREWFLALSKEIFNPMYALFIPSDNQVTYQPSPHSYVNSEHLRYLKFIGRVVGKALCDGH